MSSHVCVETRTFSTVVYLWRQSLSLDPEIADSAKLAAWWAFLSQPRLHQGSKCFHVCFWECKFSSSVWAFVLALIQINYIFCCSAPLFSANKFIFIILDYVHACVSVWEHAQKQMQALCGSGGSVPSGTWVSGCWHRWGEVNSGPLQKGHPSVDLAGFELIEHYIPLPCRW